MELELLLRVGFGLLGAACLWCLWRTMTRKR